MSFVFKIHSTNFQSLKKIFFNILFAMYIFHIILSKFIKKKHVLSSNMNEYLTYSDISQ